MSHQEHAVRKDRLIPALLMLSGLCSLLYACLILHVDILVLAAPLFIALPAFSPLIQIGAFLVCVEQGTLIQMATAILLNVVSTFLGVTFAFITLGPGELRLIAFTLGSLQIVSTVAIVAFTLVMWKRISLSHPISNPKRSQKQ